MKYLKWAIVAVLIISALVAYSGIQEGASLSLIAIQAGPALAVAAALGVIYLLVVGARRLSKR